MNAILSLPFRLYLYLVARPVDRLIEHRFDFEDDDVD